MLVFSSHFPCPTEENFLGEKEPCLVGKLDDETFGADVPEIDLESPPFFPTMRELVIIEYYTSEIGATEELKISLVADSYDGDVPYDNGPNEWAFPPLFFTAPFS